MRFFEDFPNLFVSRLIFIIVFYLIWYTSLIIVNVMYALCGPSEDGDLHSPRQTKLMNRPCLSPRSRLRMNSLMGEEPNIQASESAKKYVWQTNIKEDQKRNPILKECNVIHDRIPNQLKGTKIPKCSSQKEVKQELSSKGKQESIEEEFKHQRTSEDWMLELKREIQISDEFFGDSEEVQFIPSISQAKQELSSKGKQEPIEEELCLQKKSEDSMPEVKLEIQTCDEFFGDNEIIEFQASFSQVKQELSSKGKQEPIEEEFKHQRINEDWMAELKQEIQTSDEFFGDCKEVEFLPSISQVKQELSSKGKQEPIEEEFKHQRTSEDWMAELKLEIQTSDEFFGDCKEVEFLPSISQVKQELSSKGKQEPIEEEIKHQRNSKDWMAELKPEIQTSEQFFGDIKEVEFLPSISQVKQELSSKGKQEPIEEELCLQRKSEDSMPEVKPEIQTGDEFLGDNEIIEFQASFSQKPKLTRISKIETMDENISGKRSGNNFSPLCEVPLIENSDNIHTTSQSIQSFPNFNIFYCYMCKIYFCSVKEFNAHILAVHEKFKCLNCDSKFRSKKCLHSHSKYCNGMLKQLKCSNKNVLIPIGPKPVHETAFNPFKCSNCNFTSISKSDLQKHFKSVHELSEPIKCPHCGYTCTCKKELSSHIFTVHKELKHIMCSNCELSFSSMADLYEHKKTCPFMCPYCDYSSRFKEPLLDHINLIHETLLPPIKSVSGNNASSNKKALKIHKKSAHTPRQIELGCYYCNYVGSDKINLNIHIKSAHRSIAIKLVCNYCNLKFCELEHLLDHNKLIHETSKPCQCLHCDFTCTGIIELSRHIIAVHKELEHFKCPNCELVFSNMDDLSRHMKIYPFMCTYCDYSYRFESALLNHITSVHKNIMPFKSSAHDYVDGVNGDIQNHFTLAIHETQNKNELIPIRPKPVQETAFNPFKCSKCNYTSSSKSDVQKHLKSIHETKNKNSLISIRPKPINETNFKPFKCLYCNYASICQIDLQKHFKSVHETVFKTLVFKV